MRICAAVLACMLLASFAHAIDTAPAFADPAQQARYERIARELRCLQCRSETIADSNASLAEDLRRQLRELIAAGKTDAEIMTYMTDRYGDYVLYRPPVKSNTWLLWAAPALLVLGGGVIAVVVILRKSKLPDDDLPEDDRARGSGAP
ncbi:cytochrome c-type biogenesis protein CcmH [Povalibacter uvarum]|uniref:Cytochrome c-type biogenesis protein n=1 Tax=Povalibacter uvarum TaxID=732238 RepID=A0A841HHK5_9GAMM|nr:cytochrome c-type biogenesis protein [Povalibacter uvarum]MBB6092163.1 cytochrome c-type biogenesis protein CcmH [Povalibacter uvarum]